MQLPHPAHAAAPVCPARALPSAIGGKRPRDDKENESPCDLTPVYATEYSSEDDGGQSYKWNCNQIRTKINTLIRSGEIKVTHFQKEIGVTSNSYTNFMKSKGPFGGVNSSTYEEAHRYFRKREESGMKMPKAKKAKASDVAKFDVSDVTLEEEARGEMVPVYDTCDEVRRKIQAHLREPGVTQASFGRQIAKAHKDGRAIQGKQIADFLRKKGESSGAESGVYYGSYVFFEKLRVKNGSQKSKSRTKAEREFPGGRELRDRTHEWIWVGPGLPR